MMATDFEHTLADQQATTTTRQDTVKQRRDHQALDQPMSPSTAIHQKESHTEKMHRYRDETAPNRGQFFL